MENFWQSKSVIIILAGVIFFIKLILLLCKTFQIQETKMKKIILNSIFMLIFNGFVYAEIIEMRGDLNIGVCDSDGLRGC